MREGGSVAAGPQPPPEGDGVFKKEGALSIWYIVVHGTLKVPKIRGPKIDPK